MTDRNSREETEWMTENFAGTPEVPGDSRSPHSPGAGSVLVPRCVTGNDRRLPAVVVARDLTYMLGFLLKALVMSLTTLWTNTSTSSSDSAIFSATNDVTRNDKRLLGEIDGG